MDLHYSGCPHAVTFSQDARLVAEDINAEAVFKNALKIIKVKRNTVTRKESKNSLDEIKNCIDIHLTTTTSGSTEYRKLMAKMVYHTLTTTCQCVSPKSDNPVFINRTGILRRNAALIDCQVLLGRDLYSYLSINAGTRLIMPDFPVTVHDLYIDDEKSLAAIPSNLIVYDLHLCFRPKNVTDLIQCLPAKVQRISIQTDVGEFVKSSHDNVSPNVQSAPLVWHPRQVRKGRISLVQRRTKPIQRILGIPGIGVSAAARARAKDPEIQYFAAPDIMISGAFNRNSVIVVECHVDVLVLDGCYSPPVILLDSVTRIVLNNARMPVIYCRRGNGIHEDDLLNPERLDNVSSDYYAVAKTIELGGEVALGGTLALVDQVLLHEHGRILRGSIHATNWGTIVVPEQSRLVRILRTAAVRFYNQRQELLHHQAKQSREHVIITAKLNTTTAMLDRLLRIEDIICNTRHTVELEPGESEHSHISGDSADWVLEFNDALIELNDEIARNRSIVNRPQKASGKPVLRRTVITDVTKSKLPGGAEDIVIEATMHALDSELEATVAKVVGHVRHYANSAPVPAKPKIDNDDLKEDLSMPPRMTVTEQLIKPEINETDSICSTQSPKPTKLTKSARRRRRI